MLFSLVKRAVRAVGLDISRYPDRTTRYIGRLLQHYGVSRIFDVGANEGQYVQHIRAAGYTGSIVSFEPLSSAFRALERVAARDGNTTAVRSAIGDSDGEIDINIAGNSVSSSVFDITPVHTGAASTSAYVGREKVPIARIDSIIDRYARPDDRLFLKIDTQGFERHVLEGTGAALQRFAGIQLEMSVVELYRGETLYTEMMQWLRDRGYVLSQMEPGFSDPATGRLLQFDGVFFQDRRA